MLISLASDLRDRVKLAVSALRATPHLQYQHQSMYARRVFPHLRTHAHEGNVTLDIGAHRGVVTDNVRRLDPKRRVYMFEADPTKAAKLRRDFTGVHTYPFALTDFDGEVEFFINEKQSGFSGLSGNGRPIKVQARKLDTVMPDISSVTSMKIDVEGHELSVLRGAENLVERCQPVIMFESGPNDATHHNGLYHWLIWRGYRIYFPTRVERANELRGMTGYEFNSAHIYPYPSFDYVAVPEGWAP